SHNVPCSRRSAGRARKRFIRLQLTSGKGRYGSRLPYEFSSGEFLLEKWIVLFLLTHGGDRPVAGANERVRRQTENLFAYFLLQQFRGDKSAPDRSRKNAVTNDRNPGRIFRKVADDISDAIFRVAGSVAVGDPQTPEMDEIVRPVPLLGRGI